MLENANMQNPDTILSNYDFNLPGDLIAERPIEGRHNSKLLVYHVMDDRIEHRSFYELPEILPEGSTLVLNQSKVFPCRLYGKKPTGGKAEVFLLSLIHSNNQYPVLIKTSGKKNIGDSIVFDDLTCKIVGFGVDGSFLVEFNQDHKTLLRTLETIGNVPIPPYIRDGIADEKDLTDYQTVYAGPVGSVAAPTAGLHFTPKVFSDLENVGINKAFVTLHVGAGTFKPVSTENILEHEMHAEFYEIEKEELKTVQAGQGSLIAVGTTSLRVLESCSDDKGNISFDGELADTDIFLYPGKEVHSIKGLITNFHLPKSTLLMLVSTLVGREKCLELYEEAITNNYRFFSYGDSMLILR